MQAERVPEGHSPLDDGNAEETLMKKRIGAIFAICLALGLALSAGCSPRAQGERPVTVTIWHV